MIRPGGVEIAAMPHLVDEQWQFLSVTGRPLRPTTSDARRQADAHLGLLQPIALSSHTIGVAPPC